MRLPFILQEAREEESMIIVSPASFTLHPRPESISFIFSTSDIAGQLCKTLSLPERMLAAIIGNAAFFAPETAISPSIAVPPLIRYLYKISPPERLT